MPETPGEREAFVRVCAPGAHLPQLRAQSSFLAHIHSRFCLLLPISRMSLPLCFATQSRYSCRDRSRNHCIST